MSWKSENHGEMEDEEDYRSHGNTSSVFDDININMMSVLSLESFDADVEQDEFNMSRQRQRNTTKHRRRRHHSIAPEERGSETEAAADSHLRRHQRKRRRRIMRKFHDDTNPSCGCGGDEIDRHRAAMVITTPKGGMRSLELDLEEVKACSDLGFDLDLSLPPIIKTSRSNASSASSSPVYAASWRISSPGDHPRDIKARLKVWAQAVALASASPSPSPSRHPTA